MNRHRRRHRHDVERPGAIGAAYLAAMERDLDNARDGLRRLADLVEDGRAAGRDVSADEVRLGELVATVAGHSVQLDALRLEAPA